ncbi:MAG TPA: acyl-CoA thioester hydrolase/BAAT C-terminal domain-containing protein, partial [Myxococcota bacterium]|nr:acyl-CoA thioester hydrolase/BAAT C-terminal domain-containing protein [Myxococcota bacterium]
GTEGYRTLVNSHGIAALVIDFGDSAFSPLTHDALGTAMVEAVTWLTSDPRVDGTKVAVGGHSRGGKAAMLAAARDARVKAVLGLDPVDAPPPLTQPNASFPSVTPELMGQVTAALLLLGSEYGATPVSFLAPACAPADENFEQYAQSASAASRVVVEEIPKSGHNDFADPLPGLLSGACKAGDQPATTRARVRTLSVAFLAVVLRGDSRYEPWL